ncbi:MAG: DUF2971 domain-containing protein [Sedimenticola sp.]
MFYHFKDNELDKYVYRIISLERLLELFVTSKNVLVKPAKWEDKFENFILIAKVKHSSENIVEYNIHDRIYGQCWTFEKSSDAMWRIYSPNKDGLRIRTKVRTLLESMYEAHPHLPELRCCLGKVKYKKDKELMEVANSIFDDDGISVENIFKSLLVKRNAFKHENEVRLLYDGWTEENTDNSLYSYDFNPHKIISQIMIDPRRKYLEFQKIKQIIKETTGYEGDIKRSLLYTLPKNIVVNVKNVRDE